MIGPSDEELGLLRCRAQKIVQLGTVAHANLPDHVTIDKIIWNWDYKGYLKIQIWKDSNNEMRVLTHYCSSILYFIFYIDTWINCCQEKANMTWNMITFLGTITSPHMNFR